jgi:hypothetical protein
MVYVVVYSASLERAGRCRSICAVGDGGSSLTNTTPSEHTSIESLASQFIGASNPKLLRKTLPGQTSIQRATRAATAARLTKRRPW